MLLDRQPDKLQSILVKSVHWQKPVHTVDSTVVCELMFEIESAILDHFYSSMMIGLHLNRLSTLDLHTYKYRNIQLWVGALN